MPFPRNDSEMLIDEYDVNHMIKRGTIPNGPPDTTTLVFAPGALITSLGDSKIYRNSGTSAAPVWEDLSTVNSSEIDQSLIKTVTIQLTAAQINGMSAAPVLVLAGIAGKSILADSIRFKITRTATQFANGGVVNVQYDNTATGAGTVLHTDIAATVVTAGAGTTVTYRVPSVLSDVATSAIEGKGLYISNKTAAFITGTGTAEVTVRYHVE